MATFDIDGEIYEASFEETIEHGCGNYLYLPDGRIGVRIRDDEPEMVASARVRGAGAWTSSWKSLGAGVPAHQVDSMNAAYRRAAAEDPGRYGSLSGAHHKPDGTLVCESRQARNAVLKLRNRRDNDAGYGDHAGRNG
tara:strand:+ start:4413 stop:4826 length:414 start_codon:yes stop_codon:yes gene_type:complete